MAGTFGARYKDWIKEEDVWIETGTYHGHGLLAALNLGFKELHTIEVSEERFKELSLREPDLCKNPIVHRYLGSSRYLLYFLIRQFQSRDVVFWLDAHYQGDDLTERDDVSECPVSGELKAIAEYQWRKSVVVCIDDWNFFTDAYWQHDTSRSRFKSSDWPRDAQLKAIMNGWDSFNEDHILYFHRDFRHSSSNS